MGALKKRSQRIPEEMEEGLSGVTLKHSFRIYRCSQKVKRMHAPDKHTHTSRYTHRTSQSVRSFWNSQEKRKCASLQHMY